MSEQPQTLIYEDAEKAVEVRLDETRETVWLTLLVAESDSANKETMIRLIMNMLAGGHSQVSDELGV
ncbi:hypothetical protein [Halomonas sp. M20]|uniref:hypothetical protein n=1 Tax=Halomonas sp. M20 TaxID=2763264 RepID=UPI001D0AB950|nr:hypothetical protein [Halomonas sp. M20]